MGCALAVLVIGGLDEGGVGQVAVGHEGPIGIAELAGLSTAVAEGGEGDEFAGSGLDVGGGDVFGEVAGELLGEHFGDLGEAGGFFGGDSGAFGEKLGHVFLHSVGEGF